MTLPTKFTVDNNSERIFFRKSMAEFTVTFYEDSDSQTPLIPIDVTKYPSYTIYDINNTAVQTGVGQPEASPGTYKATFSIPADAPLSHDEQRWRIEWLLVTPDNRQIDFVEEFDVKDTVIEQSDHRELKFITLCGEDTRVSVRLTHEPSEVKLNVFKGMGNKIVDNIDLNNGILKTVDGDSYVFYYDIPGNLMSPNSVFSVVWSIRDTVSDPNSFVYQSLTSIVPSVLNMVTSVRMLIDKFQKRLGVVQAYEDSDIVEYLVRGNELVNSIYPTTTFSLGFTPGVLNVYLVLFASWYGLNAQQLLETDLGINFSGQTVTLDYDHQGALSDVMGRWLEFINNTLPAAKMSIVRRSRPVGTVAGRGYRYSDATVFTFKIASLKGGGDIVTQLTNLGLLF